jgi:hypothetical protein
MLRFRRLKAPGGRSEDPPDDFPPTLVKAYQIDPDMSITITIIANHL